MYYYNSNLLRIMMAALCLRNFQMHALPVCLDFPGRHSSTLANWCSLKSWNGHPGIPFAIWRIRYEFTQARIRIARALCAKEPLGMDRGVQVCARGHYSKATGSR
jgi:hypothetical protein